MSILAPEMIGAFSTGILGPVIVAVVKYFLDKAKEKSDAKKKDPVAESLKTNVQIEITTIMELSYPYSICPIMVVISILQVAQYINSVCFMK